MPLIPTQDLWRATIEGRPDLVKDFAMPAGATEGQARMHIWTYWRHARLNDDRANPQVTRWLRLEKVAAAMVEVPVLERAA